jgi:hypothetical protein
MPAAGAGLYESCGKLQARCGKLKARLAAWRADGSGKVRVFKRFIRMMRRADAHAPESIVARRTYAARGDVARCGRRAV